MKYESVSTQKNPEQKSANSPRKVSPDLSLFVFRVMLQNLLSSYLPGNLQPFLQIFQTHSNVKCSHYL